MDYVEQNEIIISMEQFKIMTESFYMHMYIVFDISLTKSKLEWNGYDFVYNYTIATESYSIDNSKTLNKYDMINIVNNYIRNTGREATSCLIIDNLDGTINLRLDVNRIKPKQKSKGGLL